MLDLAAEQGVSLPATAPAALAAYMLVREARSLEEYLQRYTVTLSVMRTAAAMERIAYEFVLDAASDNVRYVEVRYCPALHTPELTIAQAIDSVLAGLKRGEAETGVIARVIISALRTLPPTVSVDLAHAAADYVGDGVVGFDLAGVERGFEPGAHLAAFEYAGSRGLALTCHAGEGDGAESIRGALAVGARRLGHGVRLAEDPDLLAEVRGRGVPLEMCPTSNVHTRTVPSLDEHPLKRYFDAGLVVTINTDSRLMDGITLTDELLAAHTRMGFTQDDLKRLILNAFEHAFLPEDERRTLVARTVAELEETG